MLTLKTILKLIITWNTVITIVILLPFFNNIFSTKLLAIRIIAIMFFFIETYVKDELIDK